MANLLTALWRDRRGQDLTEYALMGGLLASVTAAIIPDMFSVITHINELLLSALQSALGLATLK
ncbi:MAG TPA: hypothetical protein VE958_07400 [Bryobacteraceae bacterium]|jgi:Flp pilus assembly pilin Flp|nr:hypothetical protein [Bryobacteraceae bacterium]